MSDSWKKQYEDAGFIVTESDEPVKYEDLDGFLKAQVDAGFIKLESLKRGTISSMGVGNGCSHHFPAEQCTHALSPIGRILDRFSKASKDTLTDKKKRSLGVKPNTTRTFSDGFDMPEILARRGEYRGVREMVRREMPEPQKLNVMHAQISKQLVRTQSRMELVNEFVELIDVRAIARAGIMAVGVTAMGYIGYAMWTSPDHAERIENVDTSNIPLPKPRPKF